MFAKRTWGGGAILKCHVAGPLCLPCGRPTSLLALQLPGFLKQPPPPPSQQKGLQLPPHPRGRCDLGEQLLSQSLGGPASQMPPGPSERSPAAAEGPCQAEGPRAGH